MPPVVIAAGIATAGAVGATIVKAKAAKKAGRVQEAAAQASIEEQRRQFEVSQQLTTPRREAEDEAINALRGILGLDGEAPDFAGTPGFEFARDEALRAVERGAAARGGVVSGNTLAELQRRAAGLASQNFLSGFLDPIRQLALGGQQAVAGQQAVNVGFNVGQTEQQAGAARASGILGAGQAISGGLSNINQAIQGGFGNFLLQSLLSPQGGGALNLSPVPNLSIPRATVGGP